MNNVKIAAGRNNTNMKETVGATQNKSVARMSGTVNSRQKVNDNSAAGATLTDAGNNKLRGASPLFLLLRTPGNSPDGILNPA